MNKDDEIEYGEFICSFDKWLPIEYQKERAKKLENLTKTKNTNK